MHPLNRLGAAVFALAFLVGVPYALLWHAAWPEALPSWDVALAHLRGWRLPPGVAAAALISALWALWGLFALALAAEAAARLRGVPSRLRPFGPLQALAATAVAATAATPAAAFADTVVQEDGRQEEQAPDREDGAPAAPQGGAEQGPVERTRTVSGFAVGSAELTERMREDLAPTVEMLREHWDPDIPVTITGHADPSGNADRNRELSEERARAVADHLVRELGEDAPDTEVEGKGSDQPVEGPAESQRRVEIAYTLAPAPAPAAPQEQDGEAADGAAATEEADRSLITVENAAATDDDGPRVVVLEIPDGAVAGAVGFAGLAGGYLLGRRGSFVPRMALSLPRRITGRPRRLALPPVPPRPEPGDDIDERVTVELDHVPGLGLTGKGADGAARRMIANALDPSEPLAVRILITEEEAVRLLGETGRDLLRDRPCEPVALVPTTEDALAVLASELHATAEEDRAPLALVISAPDARHEHALSGLLLHGQHRGITAVVLGSWPLGGSCTVDADGLISQTSQPLATLFHCSWPGSTAEEVHEAVRAHHAADHSASERPARSAGGRGSGAGRRPVLVAEDWDDDDAFVSVGDAAAWERLTRAWEEDEAAAPDEEPEWPGEEAEATAFGGAEDRAPAPDDGASVDAAFRGLREGEYGGSDPDIAVDDSWWDETPAADTASGQDGDTDRAAAPAPAAEPSNPDGAVPPATTTDAAAAPEPTDATPPNPDGAVPPVATVDAASDPGLTDDHATAQTHVVPSNPDGTAGTAGAPATGGAVPSESEAATGLTMGADASGPSTETDTRAGERAAVTRNAEPSAPAGGDARASDPEGASTVSADDSMADPGGNERGAAASTGGEQSGAASPDSDGTDHTVASAGRGDASTTRAERGTAAGEHPGAATEGGAPVKPGSAAPGDSVSPGPARDDRAVASAGSTDTSADRADAAPTAVAGPPAMAPVPSPRSASAAAEPQERRTQVRHERVPGRKAGRVRVVRVDRPAAPEPEERPAARPRQAAAPLKEAAANRRPLRQAQARATAVPPAEAVDGEEAPPAYRPQPAKPRKAGRGRVWRPRDDT